MRIRYLLALTVLALAAGAATAPAQIAIVNGASYDPDRQLAPGSFATIFGENLSSQTLSAQFSQSGQLPTELGGVTVTVDGQPAMLYFVSPRQVNFIVPQVSPGRAAVVVRNGSASQQGSMRIGPAGPGIFSVNGMGVGEGAILHGWLWQRGPFSITTSGLDTQVSIFVTGLDLSVKPEVLVGGVPVEVKYYGKAPGYEGLQQINVVIPANFAGVGRVPVVVISNGQVSNVTFLVILPTTDLLDRIPGWARGRIIRENVRRGRESSALALNTANNTALVADEEEDLVRVISLDSKSITGTISLPSDSQALDIAVNAANNLAGVALSAAGSAAIVNLQQNKVVAVVATGNFPSHVEFWGDFLLVSNSAGSTITMIDTRNNQVAATIAVGQMPSGIAVVGNTAVVANTHAGTLSVIDLVARQVTSTIDLGVGIRPREIALTGDGKKAVVDSPTLVGFLIVDLAGKQVNKVETSVWDAVGVSRIAINGNTAYLTNQLSASVTVADIAAGKVLKVFPVDPGPRALALNLSRNQLVVLCQGSQTLDIVDLGSYAVVARVATGESVETPVMPPFQWGPMPVLDSIAPQTGAKGSTFTLTITGKNLAPVKRVVFDQLSRSWNQPQKEDTSIKVSNLQVKADGSQVTATVQILKDAEEGARLIRLVLEKGDYYGPARSTLFMVTK